MKLTGFAFALVSSLALVTGTAAAEQAISDSSRTATIDCGTDGEVAIVGSMNNVTISGACTKVAISGASNTVAIASSVKVAVSGATNVVEIAAADRIAVTGTGNTVRYDKGVTRKAPKIAKTGLRNKVTRAR